MKVKRVSKILVVMFLCLSMVVTPFGGNICAREEVKAETTIQADMAKKKNTYDSRKVEKRLFTGPYVNGVLAYNGYLYITGNDIITPYYFHYKFTNSVGINDKVYTALLTGWPFNLFVDKDGNLIEKDNYNNLIKDKIWKGNIKKISDPYFENERVYYLTDKKELYMESWKTGINKVEVPGKVNDMAVGYHGGAVALEDGSVWTWGSNGRGERGFGEAPETDDFTKVETLSNVKLVCGGLLSKTRVLLHMMVNYIHGEITIMDN